MEKANRWSDTIGMPEIETDGAREYAPKVDDVARELRASYGDFAHNNKKNPLDELLFIVCSVRTNNYESVYKELRRRFPRFGMLAGASVMEISRAISSGGLHNNKSARIKIIIERTVEKFGRPTLAPLRKMSDEECESFLTSLPGVGKKVARCVMMCSLGRDVFPVDTHCWRICQRLGWISPNRRDLTCSQADMDRLQAMIPRGLGFSLHVNMLSLGRAICFPRKPKCSQCPIETFCEKMGVQSVNDSVVL
jgi:endonuclease III